MRSDLNRAFVRTAACGLFACATALSHAQFTPDPAANTSVADRTGEQVQPKIRMGPDRSMYISWFDNATGGYDVYLQRLDARGTERWARNGILIADRSFSSTVNYDLRVDAAGNALLAFNDDRAGSNQITVAKVSRDGACLWGTTTPSGMSGVTVSTGAVFKADPKIIQLTDGTVMVGWSESPGFKLRRLASDGTPLGVERTVSEAGRTISLSDLQPGDNASVIALWVRPFNTSFLSAKYLYTQKYDPTFAPQWPNTPGAEAVVIYGPTGAPYPTQGGSIQNGYFPTFEADGAGGGVYSWYETGGPRTMYVQRVRADGSLVFPLHGLPVTAPDPAFVKISAAAAFDRSSGEIVAAWTQTPAANQNRWGVSAQRIGPAGELRWGPAGTEIIPMNEFQSSFVRIVPNDGGCLVFGFDARAVAGAGVSGIVFGASVAADGMLSWGGGANGSGGGLLSTRPTSKARLDVAREVGGGAVAVWTDGSPAGDVLAQSVRASGGLGNRPCTPDLDNGTGTGTPDGGITVEDLLYYLAVFEAGTYPADLDDGTFSGTPNGGVELDDLLYFLDRYAAGGC